MIQLVLGLLQLLAEVGFAVVAIVFAILALRRWRKKGSWQIYAGIAGGSALLVLALSRIDLFSAETSDHDDAAQAFQNDFGFAPPASVKEIKLKNYVIYDACAHWMAFTYDPQVFEAIVAHDQPLRVIEAHTPTCDSIARAVYNNPNAPDWAVSPAGRAPRIYFKKDFLHHTFSDYYLWVDTTAAMVHLHVSYFD